MANKSNSSVRFLGESTAHQSAFWFYLTFSVDSEYLLKIQNCTKCTNFQVKYDFSKKTSKKYCENLVESVQNASRSNQNSKIIHCG